MRKKDIEITWEYPTLKGDTLLEQFQDFERQRGGKLDVKDIIGFINVNSASIVTGIGMPNKSLEEFMYEAEDLENYIMGEYAGNEALFRAMYENWGEEGPLMFRLDTIIAQAREQQEEVPHDDSIDEDGMFSLTPAEERRCQMLTDYIMSIRGSRSLAYCVEDNYFVYHVPGNLSEAEEESYAAEVDNTIANLLHSRTGSLVLRYSSFDPKRITVNGFQFNQGKVEIADIKTLKRLSGINPDGIRHAQSDIIFQVPHLSLL